jgi:hypothetical protein
LRKERIETCKYYSHRAHRGRADVSERLLSALVTRDRQESGAYHYNRMASMISLVSPVVTRERRRRRERNDKQ